MQSIIVIIPAFNEELSIKKVLKDIPHMDEIIKVIVVDNGSTDNTAGIAAGAGPKILVIAETKRGYGMACQSGIKQAYKYNPDIICFLDADYSDYPEDLTKIVNPILKDEADFVIGSRIKSSALLMHARFGNMLATLLIRVLLQFRYTDLGPFRAISADKLKLIEMQDISFGWTVEMQVKAIKARLRIKEVDVRYRARIGNSKISGTLKGSFLAGFYIITTIFRYLFWQHNDKK